MSAPRALLLTLASLAIYLIPLAAITCIGVLLSTVTRNSAGAVVGTLMVALLFQLIQILPGLGGLVAVPADDAVRRLARLLRTPIDWAPMVRAVWVCAAYGVPASSRRRWCSCAGTWPAGSQRGDERAERQRDERDDHEQSDRRAEVVADGVGGEIVRAARVEVAHELRVVGPAVAHQVTATHTMKTTRAPSMPLQSAAARRRPTIAEPTSGHERDHTRRPGPRAAARRRAACRSIPGR